MPDDAYTEGNAVAFAPKVSGYIIQLNIDDNTIVYARWPIGTQC